MEVSLDGIPWFCFYGTPYNAAVSISVIASVFHKSCQLLIDITVNGNFDLTDWRTYMCNSKFEMPIKVIQLNR